MTSPHTSSEASVHQLNRYPWPDDQVLRARAGIAPQARFPLGHYYCTIPDTRELVADEQRVWPSTAYDNPAIDWRGADQQRLASEVFATQDRLPLRQHADPADDQVYATDNDQYGALDAWILEAMLRHLRPRTLLETGSGFSTLIAAQTNREHLDGTMLHECVEPFPRPFLQRGLPGVAAVHPLRIQEAPLSRFEELQAGDVFFVDTTHTVKTGGDVHWIFSRILPRLQKGVYVHVHDIYLPGEYPKRWVYDGWAWNENYLVEAFLSYNSTFEVAFSAQWMLLNAPEILLEAFPGMHEPEHAARGGSALWLRKVA